MTSASPPAEPAPRLLARLNRRGFRLVMLLDAVAVFGLSVLTMVWRYGTPPWPTYPLPAYALSFGVATLVFLSAFYFGGLYEREPRLGGAAVLPRAARLSLAAGSFVALLNLALSGLLRQRGSLIVRALPFPIPNLVAVIVLVGILVAVNRAVVHTLRTRREGPPRVVLAGEWADIELAREHVAANSTDLVVVAEVDDPHAVVEVVERTDATDVLLLTAGWLDLWYPRTIGRLDRKDVTVLLRVGGRETLFGLDRLREVAGLPFVLLMPQTMAVSQRHFKRMLDLFLVVVTAPVWLLLVGLVSLHQLVVAGRPLLFSQTRVGVGGETFSMVKFRTMRVDAEAGGGPQLSGSGDPRVIPACRWVRATRADELPQIFHILTGRMSVVGPRPERPELTAGFEKEIAGYTRRHEVPPGLTGLAQIHGRYHTDAEYKLGYDLQYLVNWSPILDLEIIARTIWVVLARRV
ncbi:sugar transferase [Phycicoccus duodecadis]|uniref:Lipopolysaccharide/colanic/teichoic acid biosynthesis glycosyltransferase n=1 Tax=Phycicoccus duodecadis TaxID=173053 RepID=A0A2N3YGS9_9MICO|nr:sugar transferase [Phycicoccus duodecadis]PKW26044.1 lipopolysaccharide/colanic/teichoic acid biosynthesis glycosyltransferase [Phycicoccus duodecadis]